MEKTQIREQLLFCFKNEILAADAARMVNKAAKTEVVSIRCAQVWYQKFRSGRTSLNNEPRGLPPSKLDREELRKKVEENPRTTMKELGAQLNVSAPAIMQGLKDIGKVKKMDKWVPHDLESHQKLKRLRIVRDLKARIAREPFLHRILTCDEKWVCYDNRRRSGAYLDADAEPMMHPKPAVHQKKIMISIFWTEQRIVHYSFLERGQTMDKEKYCRLLDIVHEKLRAMQPALVNRHGVILLHDNARPHTSNATTAHVKSLGWEILPHPPYSPDLSPTDFHVNRDLDNFLANKTFKKDDDLIAACSSFLDSRDAKYCKKGIGKLPEQWDKCEQANGEYF